MRSKLSKIVVSLLLILSMVIPNIALKANAEEVDTTEKIDNHTVCFESYDAEDVKDFFEKSSYPTKDDYLFAGWYTQEVQDKAYALKGTEPTDTTYALFVPVDVLGVKAQVSAKLCDGKITDADNEASIRFVTSIPSLCFQEVGLNVTYTGSRGQVVTSSSATDEETKDMVYKSLYQVGSDNEVREERPETLFCGVSQYFKAHTITEVPNNYYETEFSVEPYWITLQGQKVTAEPQTKRIIDGANAVDGELNFVHGSLRKEEVVAKDVSYLDLTVETKRYKDLINSSEKFDILLEFENGKNVSFYIGMVNGKWSIAHLNLYGNEDPNADKNIYPRDSVLKSITQTQQDAFMDATLDFRVVRTGTDILVFLGGEHITTVDLTNNATSGVTAQTTISSVMVRHYGEVDRTKVEEGDVSLNVPFTMITTVEQNDAETLNFEYEFGSTELEKVKYTSTVVANEVRDFDLTLTAKRHTLLREYNEKFDILLEFENGKNISFYIGMERYDENGASIDGKNQWRVASLNLYANDNANAVNNIYKRNTIWATLTPEQISALTESSLDFRIVRKGIDVEIYLGGEKIATVDLTNKASGETADLNAVTAQTKIDSVTVRHYGRPNDDLKNAGEKVKIPAEIPYKLTRINNEISGTMEFVHDSSSVKDTAVGEKVLSHKLTNMDLTLWAKRNGTVTAGTEKYSILCEFDNGKKVTFALRSVNGWNIRVEDNSFIGNTILYTLDSTENSNFTSNSGNGIDLGIKREGTNIYIVIDGVTRYPFDLTQNSSGITADTTMKVTVKRCGVLNGGTTPVTIDVPFTLSTP